MATILKPTSQPGTWRRLWQGATMLVAGRIASAVCGLVQVPLVLAYLGEEAFGLWIILVALIWALALLDFGLGFAVQNRLVRCFAGHQDNEAAAVWRWSINRLAQVGFGLVLAGTAAAWLLPWPDWLGFRATSISSQAPAALTVAVIVAAAGLPLSLSARLAAAREETWRTGAWTLFASIGGLAAVWVAVRLEWPLWALTAASGLFPLGLHGGLWLHLQYENALPSLSTANAPMVESAELVREGAWIFLPQLATAFTTAAAPILVSAFVGPSAVAAFGVLQRLLNLPLQIQGLSLLSAWPVYTQAAARGDAPAARQLFNFSLILSAGVFTLPILLLLPWYVPTILRFWLGEHAPVVAPALIWLMVGWSAAQSLAQPAAALLNATRRTFRMAIVEWLVIALSLSGTALLGPVWGTEGVVFALTAPYAFILLPFWFVQARRVLTGIGHGNAPS